MRLSHRDVLLTESRKKGEQLPRTITMMRRKLPKRRRTMTMRSLRRLRSLCRKRRRISRLKLFRRELSQRVTLKMKRKKATRVNMKRKMMDTERKTTMKKAATSGARKEVIGTGTIRRTKRLMSEVIPCQTHLILLFSWIARQLKKLPSRLARKTCMEMQSTRLRREGARLVEILTPAAEYLNLVHYILT